MSTFETHNDRAVAVLGLPKNVVTAKADIDADLLAAVKALFVDGVEVTKVVAKTPVEAKDWKNRTTVERSGLIEFANGASIRLYADWTEKKAEDDDAA